MVGTGPDMNTKCNFAWNRGFKCEQSDVLEIFLDTSLFL